jgi:exonuclease SbcC
MESALLAAQTAASAAKERRIGLESACTAAADSGALAVDRERAYASAFADALVQQGFAGEVDWRPALLGEKDHLDLQTAVDSFADALNQAKGRLRQAELAVKAGPPHVDIEALRCAAEAARASHVQAVARQADAHSHAGTLAKVRLALADIDSRSEDVRRIYDTVGVLADAANGFNPSRVSFQRWVLGVYLDEVLVVASRTLFAMSKGRYRLQRQRELAGRGRPSGLDLAVFDEYSGTDRPAVTLSGGESFLAALSLALGLAETVQQHALGVRLETIFVDEGFGALDSDALELAIDALMELQQGGRLVGVISHVPELRQVIPARLEVRGGSGGSHARFIVP